MRKIYSKLLPLLATLLITLNATSIIKSTPNETQETTDTSISISYVVQPLSGIPGGSGQGQF